MQPRNLLDEAYVHNQHSRSISLEACWPCLVRKVRIQIRVGRKKKTKRQRHTHTTGGEAGGALIDDDDDEDDDGGQCQEEDQEEVARRLPGVVGMDGFNRYTHDEVRGGGVGLLREGEEGEERGENKNPRGQNQRREGGTRCCRTA